MDDTRRGPQSAAFLAILAAFLWATYYFFVLALTPGATPSALVAYPLLIGGVGYLGWTFYQGYGGALVLLMRSPMAYVRIGLIVGMQLSFLWATYTAGPVDTSLLSLVGDVALTPLLVMGIYGVGRERARSPAFVLGLVLSAGGASLTIIGNGGAEPIHGLAWLIVPFVPLIVAIYFVASARTSLSMPASAVVGHATIGGGLVSLLLSPLIPGGTAGLALGSLPIVALVVLLGLSSFFLAPVLYFRAVERAGLILPSLLMAAIPVFTLALSFALLGVVPPPLGLAGIPVAVLGALLALRGRHPPWTPDYPAFAERSIP